ncbi:hypothetical protein GCM10010377_22760 [Streptomyces viridiviolaceus]|uniref:Uncharacterized protein n=1 Tax=Streptomyces viridiviolaceus TaxID=68282 RepID=A0ABW2DR74_9ACTN|nr:hypothetical protein [Streptomyces viridiviolaceus]GHB31956.1 hypothetical protein GCM10010377_22760 [Streptomyces viridiviolaceus]
MSPAPVRFRDPLSTLDDFTGSVLVRCPRCDRIARVQAVADTDAGAGHALFAPRRLVCRACGHARTWRGRSVMFSGSSLAVARDPYFRLPLWLQTDTRHGRLWAYDLPQLTLLRQFAAASLRERRPWHEHGRKMTYVARLPAWVKSAKNRDEVLRAVDRMRASVTGR